MIIKDISFLRTKIQTMRLTKNKIIIGAAGLVILISLATAGVITAEKLINPAEEITRETSEDDFTIKDKRNYFLVIYDYFIKGQRELHQMMNRRSI